MTALKPDPDGWRIIAEPFGARLDARAASTDTATRFAGTRDAVVVGDSWVDGVAAAAVGVPFVAYGAREADLTRHGVTPVAWLSDLARLPEWLTAHFGFQGSPPRAEPPRAPPPPRARGAGWGPFPPRPPGRPAPPPP